MISYAQNTEDVVLWRTLSSMTNGFYIDVGAWHPENESVTKWFYDQGWSGVNIEPQPDKLPAFAERRPRDTNLQVAVSDQPGELSLWVPRYSALATCNYDLVDINIPDYRDAVEHIVEARKLNAIFEEHAPSREVSFLKIDVEGHEASVIASIDLSRYRPLVIVVESTSPHTNAPTWGGWEPTLLNSGYIFALFDGLNRFYVRSESAELLPKLSVPANCLDGYISYREHALKLKLEMTERSLGELTMHSNKRTGG